MAGAAHAVSALSLATVTLAVHAAERAAGDAQCLVGVHVCSTAASPACYGAAAPPAYCCVSAWAD